MNITFRVSEKGAVSVYGLQRFPVTLYADQWIELLNKEFDLRAFIGEQLIAGRLKFKTEKNAETNATT